MRTCNIIKEARELAGFSQKQLARLAGCSTRQIGTWERAEVEPGAWRLLDILAICRCELRRGNGEWNVIREG